MNNIVIDSNIFISAFVFKGKPLDVLKVMENYQINVFYSQEIQNEIIDIINRKFEGNIELIDITAKYFLRFIKIKIQSDFHVSRDPKDDHLLNLAYDSDAQFIITGDKDLLTLKEWRGIKIITAETFLKLLSL